MQQTAGGVALKQNMYILPETSSFSSMRVPLLLIGLLGLVLMACDHGLEPPPIPSYGVIEGEVTFTGTWPSQDSLVDLRFVAFRFVPQDTSDFLRLNEMVFSRTLRFFVERDTFRISQVEPGVFPYAGVAQRYGPGLLDWRPVGLLDEPFEVRAGETTHVRVDVDFQRIPPFPPPTLR